MLLMELQHGVGQLVRPQVVHFPAICQTGRERTGEFGQWMEVSLIDDIACEDEAENCKREEASSSMNGIHD
jgi:hypothetical protein